MKLMSSSCLAILILLIDPQVSSSIDHHHCEEDHHHCDEDTIASDGEENLVVMDTNQDGAFATGGQPIKVSGTPPKLEWDPNGYFTFCPCMGRFGNQAEQYLGSLAYGKALNRTIILPPFRSRIPFTDWFQIEHLRVFYPRVITMETFMSELAPSHWPESDRIGYCSYWLKNETCGIISEEDMSWRLWKSYNISFVKEVEEKDFGKYDADITDEEGMAAIKEKIDKDLPPSEHPVLVLNAAPAPYPMLPGNRIIQSRYFRWNFTIFTEAYTHMYRLFNGEPYVGIHLRTGGDWVKACDQYVGRIGKVGMASSQCRRIGKDPITMEMCYPTKEMVLEETRAAVEKYQTKHLFIATDKLSYQREFQEMFSDEVKVHHLDPDLPQIDLIILGQSEFFIGNCVSSFSSFVKRERDGYDKPSTFWSFSV